MPSRSWMHIRPRLCSTRRRKTSAPSLGRSRSSSSATRRRRRYSSSRRWSGGSGSVPMVTAFARTLPAALAPETGARRQGKRGQSRRRAGAMARGTPGGAGPSEKPFQALTLIARGPAYRGYRRGSAGGDPRIGPGIRGGECDPQCSDTGAANTVIGWKQSMRDHIE